MKRIIAIIALWLSCSTAADAQNLTANRVQLLPSVPSACPSGRVCIVAPSTITPNRIAFQDAAGALTMAGEARYLRQCAGACSTTNGDMWLDTGTGLAYIRQNGSTVRLGFAPLLSSALDANGYRIINLGAPTLGSDAATKTYVDSAVSAAGYVPTSRMLSTTAPLSGGGDLSANRTLSLTTTSDLVVAGAALSLASTVRTMAGVWYLANGSSISANGYWGPIGDSSATATLVSPFLAPCSGNMSSLRVQGNANATGVATVTIYRSAGGDSLTYAATGITCAIASGHKSCSDVVNSFSVTAGDVFLIRVTTSSWNPSGGAASVRLACT